VRIERIVGRLRASLAFTPMSELMAGDLHAFLNGVLEQCARCTWPCTRYIDYPIEWRLKPDVLRDRHLTRYRYNRPVWQSMMEVRMHPVSEASQPSRSGCRSTRARASSRSRITSATRSITSICRSTIASSIVADSLVNLEPTPMPQALPAEAWSDLGRLIEEGDHWRC
jgi:hypothetical protein